MQKSFINRLHLVLQIGKIRNTIFFLHLHPTELNTPLFLFVADGLSKLLQQGNRTGEIQGLRVCRNAPAVSHLLFADDSLLFFKADERQTRSVKEALAKVLHGYRAND